MADAAFACDLMPQIVVSPPLRASRGGTMAFGEDLSEHVVGKVGLADLHRRPDDADRADEELHLVLLPGEDVLDG